MKVYLAGKFSPNNGEKWHVDWRHKIVPDLGCHFPEERTTIPNGIGEKHDYVGPFFRELNGHGCEWGPSSHGCGLAPMARFGSADLEESNGSGDTRQQTFWACVRGIREADVVFAWIDEPTAYGTLVEIGIAYGLGKDIWVAGYPLEDLWFAFYAAKRVEFVQSPDDDAKSVWDRMLARYEFDVIDKMAAMEYRTQQESESTSAVASFIDYARRHRPNQLRADVWAKTHGCCWYCGVDLNPFSNFHIEHMQPKSRGGTDSLSNLVPACKDCNLTKGSLTVEEFRWRSGLKQFHFEAIDEGIRATRD